MLFHYFILFSYHPMQSVEELERFFAERVGHKKFMPRWLASAALLLAHGSGERSGGGAAPGRRSNSERRLRVDSTRRSRSSSVQRGTSLQRLSSRRDAGAALAVPTAGVARGRGGGVDEARAQGVPRVASAQRLAAPPSLWGGNSAQSGSSPRGNSFNLTSSAHSGRAEAPPESDSARSVPAVAFPCNHCAKVYPTSEDLVIHKNKRH